MRRPIEDGISLLTGVGIGTALMYLMDPASGAKRRQYVADTAKETLGSAGETLSSTTEHLTNRARQLIAEFSEHLPNLSENASDAQDYAAKQIRDYKSHLAALVNAHAKDVLPSHRTVRNLASRISSKASKAASRATSHDESNVPMVAGVTGGGIALLALGAGVMYLFDPERGHSRRAYLRDQFIGRKNDVSRFARQTGRHLSNKAQGYKAKAASQMDAIHERISSRGGSEETGTQSGGASSAGTSPSATL